MKHGWEIKSFEEHLKINQKDFIDNKPTLKNEIEGLFSDLEEKYEID